MPGNVAIGDQRAPLGFPLQAIQSFPSNEDIACCKEAAGSGHDCGGAQCERVWRTTV